MTPLGRRLLRDPSSCPSRLPCSTLSELVPKVVDGVECPLTVHSSVQTSSRVCARHEMEVGTTALSRRRLSHSKRPSKDHRDLVARSLIGSGESCGARILNKRSFCTHKRLHAAHGRPSSCRNDSTSSCEKVRKSRGIAFGARLDIGEV